MKLENTTDIPNERVRAIIRAVRPPGLARFEVKLQNTARHARGRAYWAGAGFRRAGAQLITLKLARTEGAARWATWKAKGRGYLPVQIGSREEALLFVLAHELRHLWQARVPSGRRVWGARGQFSERDADAFALQALRRYRRGELDLAPRADD